MAQNYTKEQNREYQRKWRAAHPDRRNRKGRYAKMTLKQKKNARATAMKWYYNNKEKYQTYYYNHRRKAHLRHAYGITIEEYNALFIKQNGVCAICHNSPNGKSLHVDHDHNTGEIRGLLCWKCNAMLGNAGDSIKTFESAVQYLGKQGID